MNFFHFKVTSSSLKVFCKKGVQKFRRIHNTTPVLGSHFNEGTDPQAATLLKRDSNTGILQLEVATRGVLWKKLFLKISQNSQENTCARVSFLIKLKASALRFIKRRLWHWCFPVNFVKFLRSPFLQSTSGQLLLSCK